MGKPVDGCDVTQGEQGTRHLVVIYKGKATEMPRHPAKELKTGTVRGILKRLGIEEL